MFSTQALWHNSEGNCSLFNTMRKELENAFAAQEKGEGHWYTPRADIAETDKAYEIKLDLPGVKAEDVEVELHEGRLWITGNREAQLEDEGKTYHRVERTYGQFRRGIHLGEDVNADEVQADFSGGVLSITVPKSEAATPKKIDIRTS